MAQTAAELVALATAQIENVSPADACAELASGTVVLYVREPAEWETSIAGAIHARRGILEFLADPASPRHLVGLDPSVRTIVHCRSGSRSALAVLALKPIGYTDVANLDGGITGWWVRAGLPTVDASADLQARRRRVRAPWRGSLWAGRGRRTSGSDPVGS